MKYPVSFYHCTIMRQGGGTIKKPCSPYLVLCDNQLISIIMTKKEVIRPFRNGLQVASVIFLK